MMTDYLRDPFHAQRAKYRLMRRRIRLIVAVLMIIFGSITLALLAWQIFVVPYASP